MKKFFIGIAIWALLAFWSALAFAQPDPRDSVILESKAVAQNLTGVTVFTMRVFITNKDTIEILTLGLRESTSTCLGYALLNRTGGGSLTFASVTTCLTGTLCSGFSLGGFANYNDNSPDRFLLSGLLDVTDRDATVEPPNATRKGIWDIEFRHSSDSAGNVRFDSARVIQSTGFSVATPGGTMDIPVNFVPAILTIGDTLPCATDVRDVNHGVIPRQYSLSQNYPNPFNANTQIVFALPKAGKTTLEVFNILGQKVNTLVDEYLTAGSKIVNWDGRDLSGREVPSGIYFYRLRSQDFLQTKKMLMIQ